MTQACLIEDLGRLGRLPVGTDAGEKLRPAPGGLEDVAWDDPEEVAAGVFFLQGATRYFQDGETQGSAGSIRTLMCNNGWVVLDDHVLLIDANMPGRADALLAAIKQTTHKPVGVVFNTHHHGDHVYGNRAIYDRTGALIVSCAAMVEELRRYETAAFGGAPGRREQVAKFRPDVAATPLMAPTQTFEASLAFEAANGLRVELLHLGMGHTRGDAIAWLPREGVMFTGDLVANGAFNIVRDADMAGWPVTLAAMELLSPSIVCPGHGACGTGSLVSDQRTFFVALAKEIARRISSGESKDALLGGLETIRATLLANPSVAAHVIPHRADLAVLSLRAQVERTYDQQLDANLRRTTS